MKMSIIAVALLASFSVSAANDKDKPNNGVEGRVTKLEEGFQIIKGDVDSANLTADKAFAQAEAANAAVSVVEKDVALAGKVADAAYTLADKNATTLLSKADVSFVQAGLANKADIAYVQAGLSDKASVSSVEAVAESVTKKADISFVTAGLAGKANASDVAAQGEMLATTSQHLSKVVSDLDTKADTSFVTMALSTKASKAELAGVKEIAEQGVSDAAGALSAAKVAQGTADKANAAVSVVSANVKVAKTAADTAQKTADTAVTSAAEAHDRITNNEAAFNQWAAQSTARADEIASGVAHNSGRLDKAEKDIAGLKSDVKNLDDKIGRVGSMAMAVGSLHYDGLTTGGAVAVGTYDGKAAIAAGAQFNVSERSAANIQFAYDGKAVGAGAGYQFRW